MRFSRSLLAAAVRTRSRAETNAIRMQGSTLKDLKHHMALQPLFLIMGAGMAMVALYIGRLALKTTDVQWTKNPEGFNAYKGKQFKFLNPLGVPYAETGKHIPDYRNVEEK